MTLLKGLKYLANDPRYFALYFVGDPSQIVSACAIPPSRKDFDELVAELRADTEFGPEMGRKAARVTGQTFRLGRDHFLLYALTRSIRPRVILETGVFDGVFSACFLKALEQNAEQDGVEGKLVSIDLPARTSVAGSTTMYPGRNALPPHSEPGWIIPDALQNRWTLHVGDSRDLLPRLAAELDPVSIFFHDSLHTYEHMMFEFDTVWPHLPEGGVLLSHDIHWNRAFRDFVRRHRQTDHSAHGFGAIRKSSPSSNST